MLCYDNKKGRRHVQRRQLTLSLVRHESQLLVEFRLRWRLQIIYQFNLVLWKDTKCRSRPPFTIWRKAWFSEHSSAKCQYQRKLRMRKAMFHSCQPFQLSVSHQPGLKWCSASRIGIICTYVWTYVYSRTVPISMTSKWCRKRLKLRKRIPWNNWTTTRGRMQLLAC